MAVINRDRANGRILRHRARVTQQEKHNYAMSWRSYIHWRQWQDARLNQLIKEKDELWQTSIGTGRSVNDT